MRGATARGSPARWQRVTPACNNLRWASKPWVELVGKHCRPSRGGRQCGCGLAKRCSSKGGTRPPTEAGRQGPSQPPWPAVTLQGGSPGLEADSSWAGKPGRGGWKFSLSKAQERKVASLLKEMLSGEGSPGLATGSSVRLRECLRHLSQCACGFPGPAA